MIEINDNTTVKEVEDSLTPMQKKVAEGIANLIFWPVFSLGCILDIFDNKKK